MVELSVIVPTHNRLDRLKRVLAALERQTYPLDSFEVIIVSDASTDGTHAFLESYQTSLDFRFVIQNHGGPAKARNTGVASARGEFVLFIDDDVMPTPTLLAEHMAVHHAASRNTVVLGPMLTPDDFEMAPWVRWEQAMLMKQYRAMEEGLWKPTARQFYTGNTSLRRALITQAGGFDEHFRRAEDVELAYRLDQIGVDYVFQPAAIGYHYADRSFGSWLEIPYAYGRNDVIFARSRGQTWILPTVKREFGERNRLIRLLVRACLDRPHLSRLAAAGLKLAAAAAARAQAGRVTQIAYSGLFSLRYYQGMTDELGDREFLFRPSSPSLESPAT